MADTQEAKWYVVHTYSGYEDKVASDLATMVESRGMQDLIQDIKIPTETVTEIKEDKKRDVERKIFPGYVLIKMIVTDDSWYVVRNIRGCTGFVGPASKPVKSAITRAIMLKLSAVRLRDIPALSKRLILPATASAWFSQCSEERLRSSLSLTRSRLTVNFLICSNAY